MPRPTTRIEPERAPCPPVEVSAPEAATGRVFAVLAAVVPMAAVWVPNALAFLPALAAAGFRLAQRRHGLARPSAPRAAAVLWGLLLVWAAVSVLWTLNPERALMRYAIILPTAIFGLAVFACGRALPLAALRRVETALVAGLVAAALVIWFEGATGFSLHALVNDRLTATHVGKSALTKGGIVSVLFLWISFLMLLGRRRPWAGWGAAALAALVAGAVLSFPVLSPRAGLAVGAVAALAVLVPVAAGVGRRWLALAQIALIVAAALLAPRGAHMLKANLDSLPDLGTSAVDRIYIWDFTATRLTEAPVLGRGFFASRYVPGAREISETGGQRLPQHPHNATLQVWLELGLPGLLWYLAFAALVLWSIARLPLPPPLYAAATGLFWSAFFFLNVSFGIWQAWWHSTLWIAAALAASALAPFIPGRVRA